MVKKILLLLALLSVLLLDSCLIVSRRIFAYTINKDGTVDLCITYQDIRSAATTNGIEPDTGIILNDEPEDVPEDVKDYESLVRDFYISDYFASCYPDGKVISRKLYEENGMLNGEVKIRFDNKEKAGIEKIKKNLVLSSDALCGYIHYIDSIASPTTYTAHVDSVAQYYLLKWPKKSKLLSVEVVPYFPYVSSTSLLEQWKKDK